MADEVRGFSIDDVDFQAIAMDFPEVREERVRQAFEYQDQETDADERVVQKLVAMRLDDDQTKAVCADYKTWEFASDYRAAIRLLATFYKKK